MVLSQISDVVRTVKEDCSLGAIAGLDSRKVSKTFSFIFLVFFLEGTSLK